MPDEITQSVDTGVVDDAVILTPDPEVEGGETVESTDPYEAYGGKESIEQAVQLSKSLQTENGVWQMFFQAGRALGLRVRKIEALFQAQQAGGEGGAAPDQPSDDDVMTYGQFKQMMDETVYKPAAEQAQAQAELIANQAINGTLNDLGVQSPEAREAILQLGDRYLGEDISPSACKAAVEKGHQDYLKLVAAERKRYVEEKRAQANGTVKVPTGSSVTAAPKEYDSEPKDVAEAIRRARQRVASL